MKFTCIIVLYNVWCKNSPAVQSILNIKSAILNVIVCDNSIDLGIKKLNLNFCKKMNFKYIDMKGNYGLSKAYNTALRYISKKNWVVIFDQDTKIPKSYFKNLKKSIYSYPYAGIHVPIVKSNKQQISPIGVRRYRIIKKSKIDIPGLYNNITAINSGMAIKKEVFSVIGNFNEKIFLDYLDHYFIKKYKKYFNYIALFGCILEQNFSDHNHNNLSDDLKRFSIYVKDLYIYCSDSFEGKIYYIVKILYRAIKLSIFYKNPIFLQYLIKRRKYGDISSNGHI